MIFTINQPLDSKAAHALFGAVVGGGAAVGGDGGLGFVDSQGSVDEGQFVVTIGAAGGQRVATGIGAFAAAGGDAGEYALIFSIDQAINSKTANALLATVIGGGAAVGGDGGLGLVNGQGAVDEGQLVVAIAAAGGQRIATGIGAFATAGSDVAKYALIFAVDQPIHGKAADALLGAVIGGGVAVGGDSGLGLVDGQGAVDKGQLVVAVTAAGGQRVAAGVGALTAAGSDPAKYALIFSVD